ncbi:MAG TPA: LytR C-terminal domain-containing protein, partial [Solirubrobacteraceae bacterium]|nr:LytR C-terminal domain-containing protein [Solirubrobacteraceae bacterium]
SYVIVVNSAPLGEYYDVQGTTWAHPPLLSDPSETLHVGSRTYGLFYVGEQIRTIAWREGSGTYWVQNTLTNSIQPREMLALAEETAPVIGTGGGEAAAATVPHAFNLPSRQAAAAGMLSKLAAAASFVCLGVLGLLALLLLSRRRELGLLREQVAQAMVLEARQRPLLAGATAVPGDSFSPALPPAAVSAPAPPPTSSPSPSASPTASPSPSGSPSPSAAPISSPRSSSLSVHRARRRPRRAVVILAGVSLLAIAAIGAALSLGGGGGSASHGSPAPAASVPVAVFNATSTPGAAHRLADTLRADQIQLAQIGNINASLGHGVYVLYPPGAATQAQRVARLIPSLSPTVAPIQPQVQSTIGRHDEIVVIFD